MTPQVISLLQLLGGLVLLLIGGEALVRGAARLAIRFGLSRLMVGMVIAGFGTSLPELVVCVDAVLAGAPGLAAGNVIGSNISNILLIVAISALIRPIDAARRGLEPEGIVLLGVSVCIVLLGLQGTIPRWQGALMIAALVALVGLKFQQDRLADRRMRATEAVVETVAPIPGRRWPMFGLVAIGFLALPVGADLLVRGATHLAATMGVSDTLIGLTVVAVGTSLPELATSAVAAARGESTIGYGNIVGSNLFNLLGIFGVATLVGEMRVAPVLVYVDGVVMIGATAVMLGLLASRARLGRGEATLMLCSYAAYITARYAYALGA